MYGCGIIFFFNYLKLFSLFFILGLNENGQLGMKSNRIQNSFELISERVKSVQASTDFTIIQKCKKKKKKYYNFNLKSNYYFLDDNNIYFTGLCEDMGLSYSIFTRIELKETIISFSVGKSHALFLSGKKLFWLFLIFLKVKKIFFFFFFF